jgi:hypothetical protein
MTTPLEAVAEDGNLSTSAEFGVMWCVRVFYNTDPEGNWVEDDDYLNYTLHGPFETEAEAGVFLQHFMEDDTDVKDMDVIVINKVRP